MDFPGGLAVKEFTCNAEATGDVGSIPELGRSPGVGDGNPLQCSCLENPVDRGAWLATVHRVAKSQTRPKQLGTHGTYRPLLKEAEFLMEWNNQAGREDLTCIKSLNRT